VRQAQKDDGMKMKMPLVLIGIDASLERTGRERGELSDYAVMLDTYSLPWLEVISLVHFGWSGHLCFTAIYPWRRTSHYLIDALSLR
jgi:hypothetical protein